MDKILVIEDSEGIRENIIEILELAGYDVMFAVNGTQGVTMANKAIPDLILCDIMMPELDGYGVLHLLNKNPETTNIPFIFITAKSDRGDLRKGMEMGADDYITKPFGRLELLSAIESRLKKRVKHQDLYDKKIGATQTVGAGRAGIPELKKMITEANGRNFKKDQVVHYEGDKALGVYFVLSGKIKTVKLALDGRELITNIYQADDFLGINIILSNTPYTDTATALEDSLLCFFPKAQFEELLHVYPDIAEKFLQLLSREVRDKDTHLLQLAYQSVRKRIAESILRLFRKQDVIQDSVTISRDDLAALSGTASETVSRTLTEFRNEGLIEKNGNALRILNHDKISMMRN